MAEQAPPPAPLPTPREEAPNGLAALLCGVLGVTAVPVVLSIVAVVLGRQARAHARAHPERFKDEFATVGMILGWVGIGIGAVALFGALLVLALVLAF